MQVENYLKNYQPVIYKTISNAISCEKLSHAYLLVGNPGTPLLETAKFLAKSILCDDPDPLACNNCITCLRIDDNNYPDFILLDGSKESIKKGSVSSIANQFEKEAFEEKGIMIYVLHLIENMTEEAINAILKFLEEPKKNVYAFLTTNNENIILPTIVSRCQTLHLKLVDRNQIIQESISLGVQQVDAELLSSFHNNAEIIYDIIFNEEKEDDLKTYNKQKELLEGFLKVLNKQNKNETVFYTENKIIPFITTKESLRMFLDMLTQIFEDLINIQNSKVNVIKSYDTILHELADKLPHADQCLLEILKQRNLINLNINMGLQISHLMNVITKE